MYDNNDDNDGVDDENVDDDWQNVLYDAYYHIKNYL